MTNPEENRRSMGADSGADFESVLGDLEELRREAETLHRTFDIPPKQGAKFSGQDGSGAVRVTVGGQGQVAEIELDPTWRRSVGVDGLGSAVVEAVTNAGARRLTAWGKKVAEKQDEETTATDTPTDREQRDPGTASSPPSAPADDTAARQSVMELLSMLEGVERELDEFEQRVTRRMQKQITARGPSNMVTVTMAAGGNITGVEFEPRFLERTTERAITAELRAAIDAAYDKAGKLSADALLDDGPLAEITRLGGDPNALLRKLGLDTRQPPR